MDGDDSGGGRGNADRSVLPGEVARPVDDAAPTPADLVCLQAAVDEWQREREELIRRLQAAESGAQEKQAAEVRLREALEQIEALKRSAHAVRARLEAEAQAAKKRVEQAREALERSSAAAEELRVANAELTTALEAAQWRLADLETESGVHQEEIARLERERAVEQGQIAALEAEMRSVREELAAASQHAAAPVATEPPELVQELIALRSRQTALEETIGGLRIARDQLQSALDAAHQQHGGEVQGREDAQRRLSEIEAVIGPLRKREEDLARALDDMRRERVEAEGRFQSVATQLAALEEGQAESQRALDATRAAHAEELTLWQATASEREAELVTIRDELARRLEEEQSQTYLAREEAAGVGERTRGLEADLLETTQRREALEQELTAEREERQRAISLLETASRQREEEHRQAVDELRSALQGELATLAERTNGIQAERDAARRRCAELEQELIAAVAEQQRLRADLELQQRERAALTSRLAVLEDELRTRDAKGEHLSAEIQQLRQQHAEALRAAAEATRTREQEWQSASESLQRELDALAADGEGAIEAAQAHIRMLDEQLVRRTAELSETRAQVDVVAAATRQHLESLAAAAQREVILQQRCDELTHQAEGLTAEAAAALNEQGTLAARITELETERQALRLRIDETTAITAQLERECERLRRERSSTEDTRKLKAEHARLEAKIAEIDRQHSEAVQRHSAAVAGYMVELNQRGEALHARELELEKVTEELALTRQACEDATAQLAADRQERADLEQQLAELRAMVASAGPRTTAEPARKTTAAPAASPRPSTASARPPAGKTGKEAAAHEAIIGPITLIHLEENTAFREPVREVMSRIHESRYINTLDLDRPTGPGARMLAVNLLNRAHDPLTAIAASVGKDADHQDVFAYCAEGSYGFSFGPADFFPQPVDPNACVSRLLESRGMLQRLLAVSENIEMTSNLREVFRRMNCSTSVALDLRQVVDLLPMIDPEVVLIDLALPRGDGLRLVSRLRSDPKTRELPLAILLPVAGNVVEFRQHAMRAARESSMSPAELAQALGRRLGAPPPADAPAKRAGLLQSA